MSGLRNVPVRECLLFRTRAHTCKVHETLRKVYRLRDNSAWVVSVLVVSRVGVGSRNTRSKRMAAEES